MAWEQQLSELDKLQIVPEGRKSVRIFRAGYLAPVMIKAIGQKLAAAGVQDANFYPEGMHGQKVENWREYLAVSARIFLMVWSLSFR